MGLIARMLAGLLMRSGWLLPHGRADWLEGLVAEAAATRAGRGRVAWLLGGVWLLAGELLRRSVIQVLTFIAAAELSCGSFGPAGRLTPPCRSTGS